MSDARAKLTVADRPNLKDVAASYLRDRIFAGRLKPGAKIDQDLLAAELGCSRLPVREAIITLAAEGLVDNIPRRGAFVAQLTQDDVLDHYIVFGTLSGLAAERAATSLSDEDLDRLEQINEKIKVSDDPEEQEELNFRFHQVINRAGASHRLTAVISLLATSMPSRFFEFTSGWGERASIEHAQIVEALRAHQPAVARDAVAGHLRSGGERAVEMLSASGFWDDEPAAATASSD
jgi:DNA-binding GntR family transcriptional regulator